MRDKTTDKLRKLADVTGDDRFYRIIDGLENLDSCKPRTSTDSKVAGFRNTRAMLLASGIDETDPAIVTIDNKIEASKTTEGGADFDTALEMYLEIVALTDGDPVHAIVKAGGKQVGDYVDRQCVVHGIIKREPPAKEDK